MLGNVARHIPSIILLGVATLVLALSLRPVVIAPAEVIVAARLVALALLAAGGALWLAGRPLAAVAAALAGLSWTGVTWSIERVTGADAIVGAGLLLAPLLVPLLVVLVMAMPGRSRVPARLTPVVAVLTIVMAVSGVARALVYEPLLDLDCGPFCGHSPVVIAADLGLAAWFGAITAGTSAIVCGAIALWTVLGPAPPQAGGGGTGARVLTATAMGALSAAAALDVVQGMSGVTPQDLASLVAVRAGACLAIASAAVMVAADRLSVGRNLARIAGLLAAESDRPTAESLLRDAVGDPELSLGYWTDERGYVGATGDPLDLAAPGRQRTELTSRGRPVAIVLHATRALPVDLVDETFGPAARLAIQNESLELELERRLEELRASRRRVVEAGDVERRELERDLHDGAQQLLLALSFEIRRGERAALASCDPESAAAFAEIRGVAGRILEQLRVLAHGIHPTILTNLGLGPALATYLGALDAPPPLTVAVARRLPPASEASAYAIATALIAAAPAGARTSYSIRDEGTAIRIVVGGDLTVPDHVLDRLGAAGGSAMDGDTGIELVLPCV